MSPELLRVEVFYHPEAKRWITINNRGFTTFCLAGLYPTKIIPIDLENGLDKLNRINGDNSKSSNAIYVKNCILPTKGIGLGNEKNGIFSQYIHKLPSDFSVVTQGGIITNGGAYELRYIVPSLAAQRHDETRKDKIKEPIVPKIVNGEKMTFLYNTCRQQESKMDKINEEEFLETDNTVIIKVSPTNNQDKNPKKWNIIEKSLTFK